MNLLEETIERLKENNKTTKDVEFVSADGTSFTWADFIIVADKEYDDGFGSPEVNLGLVVVGKDFWLERHEYDGSEHWEYKELPTKLKPINKVRIYKTVWSGYLTR